MAASEAEIHRVEVELRELLSQAYGLKADDLARVDAAAPLFGDALGLDSLDSLALVVALEERFGVTLQNDATTRKAFGSIGSLSKYLAALRSGRPPS